MTQHTITKGISMQTVDQLGTIAAETAMRSAAEYVRANGLKVLDYEAATACLRSYCKAYLPQALADAKSALDCGMGQVAEATFKATMALAGIEAAKEFAWPADYQPTTSRLPAGVVGPVLRPSFFKENEHDFMVARVVLS